LDAAVGGVTTSAEAAAIPLSEMGERQERSERGGDLHPLALQLRRSLEHGDDSARRGIGRDRHRHVHRSLLARRNGQVLRREDGRVRDAAGELPGIDEQRRPSCTTTSFAIISNDSGWLVAFITGERLGRALSDIPLQHTPPPATRRAFLRSPLSVTAANVKK